MLTECYPLDYVTHSLLFRELFLDFFFSLMHECVEMYMDDFNAYGDSFNKALVNLEKVLNRCRETNLALSNEKCNMLLAKGIVLRHHISFVGIKVYFAKIEVIDNLVTPATQREVRDFMGHAGYYKRFIETFTKITSHLFKLLAKEVDFCWSDDCQKTYENLKHIFFQP